MISNDFRASVEFTPGAQRALERACRWLDGGNGGVVGPEAVLLGLLGESECRAAAMLSQCGITIDKVCLCWPKLHLPEVPDQAKLDTSESSRGNLLPFSPEVQSSVDLAAAWLAARHQAPELATEHLLWGLAAAQHEVGRWLDEHGVAAQSVEDELYRLYGHLSKPDEFHPLDHETALEEPIDVDEILNSSLNSDLNSECLEPADESAEMNTRADRIGVLRVIDAAANRAREGLRVVEDYVRFILDDSYLTGQTKGLRHQLMLLLEPICIQFRLAARETQADVGTRLSTESEQRRDRPDDVLTANFCRIQESLRTLEEFGKLIDPQLAAGLEALRYQSYTLQRAVEITRYSRQRLAGARLYVLIDAQATLEDFQILARDLVLAGVDVLQLRDKRLDDRVLLSRAHLLREMTLGSDTLFVMNDRPDLALLARADGIHVGQEELPLKDVRYLVGPEMLIGVSVHSLDQARAAVLDGANYLGVGPTFASETKAFDHYPGVALLQAVAAEIRLPVFAIGGIARENLPQVLAAGIKRVAVSSAVMGSDNPAATALQLKDMLRG